MKCVKVQSSWRYAWVEFYWPRMGSVTGFLKTVVKVRVSRTGEFLVHLVTGPTASNILHSGDNLVNYLYCTYNHVLWILFDNFIFTREFWRCAVFFYRQFLNLDVVLITAVVLG